MMAWGWSGRGRGGWFGPWPGRGPFSHLPPWERPGWLFGRGACWRLFGSPAWYEASRLGYGFRPYLRGGGYPYPYVASSKDEIAALEESKEAIEEELKGIDARIDEIKKAPRKT